MSIPTYSSIATTKHRYLCIIGHNGRRHAWILVHSTYDVGRTVFSLCKIQPACMLVRLRIADSRWIPLAECGVWRSPEPQLTASPPATNPPPPPALRPAQLSPALFSSTANSPQPGTHLRNCSRIAKPSERAGNEPDPGQAPRR